jgi:hypothetical protein
MPSPSPFGWRTSWIAVKGAKASALVSELQLLSVRSSAWDQGIQEAGKTGIFITPMVSGWVLIVGLTLPDASDEDTLPLIVRLSEVHGSVQYFGNHRIPDYYAWAKAEGGRLVRAYAYLGEQGATLWDRGELTKEELDLGLIFDQPVQADAAPNESALEMMQRLKDSLQKCPTEEDVFSIARAWSIDPTQIEEYEVTEGLGILGHLQSF